MNLSPLIDIYMCISLDVSLSTFFIITLFSSYCLRLLYAANLFFSLVMRRFKENFDQALQGDDVMAIVVTGIAICFLIGQSLSFEIFQITGKGRHLSFLNLTI